MDLRGQEIKNTYGNVVTIGSSAGSPTTGELTNGQNSSFTASFVSGDFGVGITPNNYANLNTLTIGSAAASAGGIIDFTGTSGRLASIYTEASGKIVLAADPTNGEAGTSMEFNVDGSNAMFIDSSQRVGVNTTSPVSALTVVGTTTAGITVQSSSGASNGLKIFNDSITDTASIVNHYSGPLVLGTANTERMRIDSTGNVGIGTNNPNAILDIQDANPQIQFTDSVNTSAYSRILGTDTGSLYIDSDYGNAGASSNIIFRIDGGSEKMRITATGNVGINTSAPDSLFHIQNLDGGSYRFGYGGTSDVYIDSDNVYYRSDAGGSNYMALISGNVGIGTTTPETKLDVDGDIQTAAPETSTNAAWKLGNVGLGGVEVGPIDYITVSVGGFVVKLPIAIFPETQAFYDRVIADGGTFEGLLGYESAVTILKAQ